MSAKNHRITTHWLRAIALGFVVALSLGVGEARADDAAPSVEQIQAAERAFAAGGEAYKVGNYAEAAGHFERADANAPNERVLELAITARQKAGQLDRAATLAQLGITRHPGSERLLKIADPIIQQAKKELLVVQVTCDQPCSLIEGTRIVQGAPAAERVLFLTPGDHTVRAGWSEGRTASESVTGAAGAVAEVSFTAPPIPEKEPEPAGPPPSRGDAMADQGPAEPPSGMSPLYFWIGAGLTAAVGGVTVWSGIDTLNNPGKQAVIDGCLDQGTSCDLYQQGKDKELRTNILIGGTAVLGVGTAVLGAFFTNWSGESTARGKSHQKASIQPWVNVGNGAMAGATGRF